MEGLALQVLVRPAGDTFAKKYSTILDDCDRGETLKRVIEKTKRTRIIPVLGSLFVAQNRKRKAEKKRQGTSHVDGGSRARPKKKLSHTIVETNIQ